MNYQNHQRNDLEINLEAMDDKQLLSLMDLIPKILASRKAQRIKEFMAETRKKAKEKGFRVSFEKIKSKRKPRTAKVQS